jgi:proteasome accessory factor A
MVDRICDEDDITAAGPDELRPPQTTRARLRGQFIRKAKERKRDYTVDWVHLKLNDQAQRTVLCKDPFKARDERVERLIASL